MGVTAKDSSINPSAKKFEVPAPDTYPARCVHVIDLGTRDSEYQGEKKKKREVMIVWELSELMSDGRPFSVKWRGTLSLSDKSKLNALLAAWRGKKFTEEEKLGFELGKLLDKPCLISITHDVKSDKVYARVGGVLPLPKGMQVIERHNELIDFGITDLGTETFDKLWPWVKDLIRESDEGKKFFDMSPEQIREQLPSEEVPW